MLMGPRHSIAMAALAAWNARRFMGEDSRQYAEALDELQRVKAEFAPRPPRTYKCTACGKEGHNAKTCQAEDD